MRVGVREGSHKARRGRFLVFLLVLLQLRCVEGTQTWGREVSATINSSENNGRPCEIPKES